MPCLNKTDFNKPLHLKTERHPVPEYGPEAYVHIRELTSHDLLKLQEAYGKQPSGLDFACDFLAVALVDDAGSPLFASSQEAKDNLNLPLPAIDALLLAALKVSGMEGKVEDEKN